MKASARLVRTFIVEQQSAESRVLGPAAFATFLQSERIKWADVVKRSGAKLD